MKHLESLRSTKKRPRKSEIDLLRKKQVFAAARTGDEAKFRWYLEQGYPIEAEDNEEKRDTVLIAACRFGWANIVQIALEYDAKNDPHPEYGQTALQVAVASGHMNCVKVLLETASLSKADRIIVNHEDHAKEAPLHVASRCGNLHIVQLLVKHGANIFCVDAKGRTCLHCAVQSGHDTCLKYLIQVGGHQLINEKDQNGLTCLYMAIKQGNLTSTKILMQSGADLAAITETGINILELAKGQSSKKMVDLICFGLRAQFYSDQEPQTERINIKSSSNATFSSQMKVESNPNNTKMEDSTAPCNVQTADRFFGTAGVNLKNTASPNYEINIQNISDGIIFNQSCSTTNCRSLKFSNSSSSTISSMQDVKKNPANTDNIFKCNNILEHDSDNHKSLHNHPMESIIVENNKKEKIISGGVLGDVSSVKYDKCMDTSKVNPDENGDKRCFISNHDNENISSAALKTAVVNRRNQDENKYDNNGGGTVSEPKNTNESYAINSNHTILTKDKFMKFNKMIKLGIPLDAVAQKMALENCTRDEIDAFKQKYKGEDNGVRIAGNTSCSTTSDHSEQYASTTMVSKVGQLKDSCGQELVTYKKMLSCKVPPQCVVHKMIQDGIALETIQSFANCNGMNISHLNLPVPPIVKKTNRNRKKIHWKSIPKDKIKHSLWASTEGCDNIHFDDCDIKNVQELFAITKTSGPITKHIKASKTNGQRCSFVDAKRSYNISIALAQYKGFETYDELCNAVASLDASKVTREQIENMISLLPSDVEMKKVHSYTGSSEHLGNTEKFFLSVSKIPKFRQKLNVFLYIQQFEENRKSLHEQLMRLDDACRDIVNNYKLSKILKLLLIISNFVNESAGEPKVEGIRIDSLIKTANKIGSDGKTRLIDIVTANILKQAKENGDSIIFWDELKSVLSASRIDIQDCATSLKSIHAGLTNVKNVIGNIRKDFSTAEDDVCSIKEKDSTFIQYASKFLSSATVLCDELENHYLSAEQSYKKLCMFFAEEPSTCKASSIFAIILEFSEVVKRSKNVIQRRKSKQTLVAQH